MQKKLAKHSAAACKDYIAEWQHVVFFKFNSSFLTLSEDFVLEILASKTGGQRQDFEDYLTAFSGTGRIPEQKQPLVFRKL